jgi:7-keto-8-aminopelargonate synthetase-like enzyme
MTTIKRREDVDPDEGLRKYGDVEFADPVNHTYPIDTAEHVRAAWDYIHHIDNAAKYSSEEIELMEERVRQAAKEHGVDITDI